MRMLMPNPSIDICTTLDISEPGLLLKIIRRIARLMDNQTVVFCREDKRTAPVRVDQDSLPDEVVEEWETSTDSIRGIGFQFLGQEDCEVSCARFGSGANRLNAIEITVNRAFIDKNIPAITDYLAEMVHDLDGVVGTVTFLPVRLWQRGGASCGLVSIPHLTCFGTPYIELFGREKVLGAPVFRTKEFGHDAIVLQLFESFVPPDTEQWQQMQRALREHLGNRYFRDPNEKFQKSSIIKIGDPFSLFRGLFGFIFAMNRHRWFGVKSASGEPVIGPKLD
jgi:hypothetical protein